MPNKNPEEIFVLLLSNLRHGAEQSTKFYQEVSSAVQDQDIKEVLEARSFISSKILDTIDECFRIINEKPVKASGRLYDVFIEDFRKEINEIPSPRARRLYVLAKLNQVVNLRKGEYMALIAAADLTGHYAVGVLLETALADKLALGERFRRLMRERLMERVAGA
ncbi:MAG: ferritin-like domain-containing protein [Acidobacteria bacterium]|nr:ferritin-like domain-containing protein [Acidobacteriota bacterium]